MIAHLRVGGRIVKSGAGSGLGVVAVLSSGPAVAMANDNASHAQQQHGNFLTPDGAGWVVYFGC
jgi:hypothetical protein